MLTASGTYLSKNPQGSAAEFKSWSGWARLMHNHPELEALSLIALVRAPELAAFHAHVAGVPYKPPAATSTTSTTGAKIATAPVAPKLTPNGRSFECLPIGTVGRTAASQPAGSFDVCSSNHALLATRDSGQSLYNGVAAAGGGQALEILTPIYRSNVLPRSDVGRRAAFAGWVREVLAPTVLLSESMGGLPEGAARLRHHAGAANDVYTYGTPPAEPIVTTTSFHGGWSLKTFAPTPSEAVGDHGDAIALLVTGLLASVLAGALVLGLRRPGAQAAPVVIPVGGAPRPARRPLRPLTGLPNRGLTLDRAERMLARAGRNSSIMVGALFVDIDWFKDVNEKLGQEAGDQLLKIVAERLENTVRTHDTVGRYGGDEFVDHRRIAGPRHAPGLARAAHHRVAAQAGRDRGLRPELLPDGEHRRRLRPLRDPRRPAPRRPHGPVRGQGRRQGPLHALQRQHALDHRGPGRARGRAQHGAPGRAVLAALPAGLRAVLAAAWSRSRRCCAGSTRPRARSRPPSSSRSPRRAA